MHKQGSGRIDSGTGLGLLAVIGAAAFWGVAAAVAKGLFEAGVEPIELAQARSYVAAVGFSLLPGAWSGGMGIDRRSAPTLIGLGLSIPAVTPSTTSRSSGWTWPSLSCSSTRPPSSSSRGPRCG